MRPPITLHTGPTPNGRKVTIALEEMELGYSTRYVDILAGDQHAPEFLKLNPNNKFPVIEDFGGPAMPDGRPFVLWESGAILWYLAERTGRFLPRSGAERHLVNQWLMFQMSGVGPMFGQMAHFAFYAAEKHPYALQRYSREMLRLLGVMDRHLEGRDWFAGDYSIADMAILPWVDGALANPDLPERPHLAAWAERMRARPAVARGMAVLSDHVRPETVEGGLEGLDDTHRSQLFGEAQHARN
ncbi:MAG: glutathione S-transferase N-terminal domain-containing protein [Litorimonas sp.]